MKGQRSIVGLVLNWFLKSVRVGTAMMQQEVSSVSPPPLCGAPNFLKEKHDVEELLGSAALPRVTTGWRQSASWPPARPEDKVRAETPPYSSKHLKKLFLERDSVIFTAPPPPGGLLSFCWEAKGGNETQSAPGRCKAGSVAGRTAR